MVWDESLGWGELMESDNKLKNKNLGKIKNLRIVPVLQRTRSHGAQSECESIE